MFKKTIINSIKPLNIKNSFKLNQFYSMSTAIKAESVKITTPNGHTYDQPTGLFINNEFWQSSNPEKKLKVEDPSTGKHILDVESCTAEDVKHAIEVSHDAFHNKQDQWAALDPYVRAEYLYKIGEYLERT